MRALSFGEARFGPEATAGARIWENIFGRHPAGLDQNFFLLGGDRALADSFFCEIEDVTGRIVPSAMIDYAPTIASLSTLLSESELPAYFPLIRMKHGGAASPVFLVHGLGGSIGELYRFVSHLDVPNAIYGIEGKGVDGREEPLDRVADMAALYLAAIEEVEPRGPYLLIGYSFGGLIAFEMAQQIKAAGKEVALLTMIDANTDAAYMPLDQRLHLAWKRLRFHLREMGDLPFPGSVRYIMRKAGVRLGISPDPQAVERKQASARPLSFEYAWQSVANKAYAAMATYRPNYYNGAIRFVTADTESDFFPRDPAAVWKRLAASIEVERAPGNHEGLIHSGAAALGTILTRHIREARESR